MKGSGGSALHSLPWKKALRERFGLDKPDPDFGVDHIIATHNAKVTHFLYRKLKEVARETRAGHGGTAVARFGSGKPDAFPQD